MKIKEKILKKLETKARTTSLANRMIKENGIDPHSLNKYWIGDIEPMGTKKYFFTARSEEEFKKFIISNRDYSIEIKKNLKNISKKIKLAKNEKNRKCTNCKTEFVTKIDKLGVSYDTRCAKCKKLEKNDKFGRLNGRLGKIS